MGTATGLTAERMLQIEAESIVSARIDGDNLILKNYGGQEMNLGSVRGGQGIQGPGGTITSINGKGGSAVTLTAADIGSIDGNYAASTERIGLVELATATETQALLDSTKVVTPADLASLSPSANRLGLSRLATAAQVTAGTSADTYISPLLLAGFSGVAFAIAAGTFITAPANSGDTRDTAVVFPAGRFTVPPIVLALAGSNRYQTEVLASSRTATGFTARVTNFTQNVTQNATGYWIAIQMKSTSAVG